MRIISALIGTSFVAMGVVLLVLLAIIHQAAHGAPAIPPVPAPHGAAVPVKPPAVPFKFHCVQMGKTPC